MKFWLLAQSDKVATVLKISLCVCPHVTEGPTLGQKWQREKWAA